MSEKYNLSEILVAIGMTMKCKHCPCPCNKRENSSMANCVGRWQEILTNIESDADADAKHGAFKKWEERYAK